MTHRGYSSPGPSMVPGQMPQQGPYQQPQAPQHPPQQQNPWHGTTMQPQGAPYQAGAYPQQPGQPPTAYQQHVQQHAPPPQPPPYQQQIPSQQFGRPFGTPSLVSKKPDTLTFEIDYYSPELDLHYKGQFTVRRPRMGDQMRLEARKTEILGGYHYDPANPGCGTSAANMRFAEAMAFLEVCLIAWPMWWTGCEDVEDPIIIELMYQEAQKVDPFREVPIVPGLRSGWPGANVHGEPGEASDNQHHHAGPGDLLESMVDEEIQYPGDGGQVGDERAGGSGGRVPGGDAPEK